MHDTITIGIPVFTILLAMLVNQRGQERLEGRFDRMESRIDRIQADLARFYEILGEHTGKIEILSKK